MNWWFKDQLGTEETEMVVNGEVVNGNVDRMTLIGLDLVIHNALSTDTGMYTCVENYGFGEHHKTFLTISGSSFCSYRYFHHLSIIDICSNSLALGFLIPRAFLVVRLFQIWRC